MTQRVLSLWMKVIIVLFAVCGIVIFFVAVPFIGNDFAKGYPEYAYCFLPWLVFIDLMAIPCYVVLGYAWRIAQSISKEEAFTKKNSQRLKKRVCTFTGNINIFLYWKYGIFVAVNESSNNFRSFLHLHIYWSFNCGRLGGLVIPCKQGF